MTEQEIRKIADDKIIDYAKTVNPIEWHKMAIDWNYDSSKTFLKWLITNQQTEIATILMIYWMSSPKHGFEYQNEIEKKYTSGFYSNQNLSFNPKDDDGLDWTQEYPDLDSSKIPPVMFDKIDGEKVLSSEEYIEGIPENIFNEIENLYEEYEID
ncbi:DUF4274 domain-containing protein [Zobellia roscoffensis]|uniref:DUF4274 domain-containing protein n=1 Tax=Zobellia roscoffensis TaxID=2779508 RepID=UPI00188A4D82|nr:DUF4274 domain-containing protein [Zobellia roscoffensis]